MLEAYDVFTTNVLNVFYLQLLTQGAPLESALNLRLIISLGGAVIALLFVLWALHQTTSEPTRPEQPRLTEPRPEPEPAVAA